MKTRVWRQRIMIALLALGLGGCALLSRQDPVQVTVVGIEPLPGQDLEMRVALSLRVQNPNGQALDFDGMALTLKVNGQPLASGVSDQAGHIGRYAEQVVTVPMSISAFGMLRQIYGLDRLQGLDGLPYRVDGKLSGRGMSTWRFSDSGTLKWPDATRVP
ncbi:LEA type 2 family protein [Pseudomonas monteilii]|uniref:LEA type 2 family protein n=1 Tax=Pseudomonas alabamensis TaxID=3064349 RepID=UPI00271376D6|nr:LEA type 2 family protein [Pseudomonas sp. 22-AL-CL-001]MDO7912602.1 LEA type 2 family protein [Pseudomonas sp. 22-AL-CL-001]